MKPPMAIVAIAALTAAVAFRQDEPSAAAQVPQPGVSSRPASAALPRLRQESTAILLIDAQPLFWGLMHGPMEPVLARTEQLLAFADMWRVPVIATFEDPAKRDRQLPDRLERVFPEHGKRFGKRRFDCTAEPEIAAALRDSHARQIVVAGAETDVCVLQSVLGLLDAGYDVFVLEDCIFSHEANVGPALRRMELSGAVPSTFKTFYYEFERAVVLEQKPEGWDRKRERLKDVLKNPYDLPASSGR